MLFGTSKTSAACPRGMPLVVMKLVLSRLVATGTQRRLESLRLVEHHVLVELQPEVLHQPGVQVVAGRQRGLVGVQDSSRPR